MTLSDASTRTSSKVMSLSVSGVKNFLNVSFKGLPILSLYGAGRLCNRFRLLCSQKDSFPPSMRICKVCAKLHPAAKRVLKAELPPNMIQKAPDSAGFCLVSTIPAWPPNRKLLFPDTTTMFSADLALLSQACLSNCVACVKYPHIAVLFHN